MRKTIATLVGVLFLFCASNGFGQIIGGGGGGGGPDTISVFAVNNSGYVQNGPGGADNLVLFEFTPESGDPPKVPPPTLADIEPILFTVVGDLSSGLDLDGDGVDDSLGTFSGLEWSSGMPGVGTLIGCVLNEGAGSGEFYQIDPNTGVTTLIGQSPVDGSGDQLDFSDLAFNPTDGLMYGLMNDITDDDGDLEFGFNSLWIDTNGDLVPDTRLGDQFDGKGQLVQEGTIRIAESFCLASMQTLASGLAFDANGLLFIYDSMDEAVLVGGVNSGAPGSNPCVGNFDENDTDLDSSEIAQGNGLAVDRQTLIIGSDALLFGIRNTIVSFYEIPDPFPAMDPDPIPEVIPAGFFSTEFFQTGFQAAVAIGDLVGALADLSNLPPTFPDSIVVNNGMPAKDAVLEGVAASDDFRYCISAAVPAPNASPVDLTFVFTIPNPAGLTLLGIQIESHANVPNLEHTVSVFNLNTNQFDEIGSEAIFMDNDNTITVDLTTTIDDYVNSTNGTLTCRIGTNAVGLVQVFPWQVKYDSVLVVSE